MPHLIDYSSRGSHLFPIIYRMAAEGGYECLTVRQIAAGFDLSPGSLRHNFPNHGDLMQLTMKKLVKARQARLDSLALSADHHDRLRIRCVGAIPQDYGGLIEAKAWLAFEERARHDPGLATIARFARDCLLEDARHWLRCVGVADADLVVEAHRLRAVIDGLTSQVCDKEEPLEAATAIAVLEGDLRRYAGVGQ